MFVLLVSTASHGVVSHSKKAYCWSHSGLSVAYLLRFYEGRLRRVVCLLERKAQDRRVKCALRCQTASVGSILSCWRVEIQAGLIQAIQITFWPS